MIPKKLKFALDNFKIDEPLYEDGCFAFTCYLHDKCSICPFEKECFIFYGDIIPSLTVDESQYLKPYFPEFFI